MEVRVLSWALNKNKSLMADFNKGDVSEAILACAIAARFKKRLDVISQ